MFFGACAGSTAGGLKISRVIMMVKMYVAEIRQMISPNRVITVKYEDKPLSAKMQKNVAVYFVVYMILFTTMLLNCIIFIRRFYDSFQCSCSNI